MSARGELLARAVEESVTLLKRYLAGFDETNACAQPPNLPNHVAWTLGHLATTMHRAAGRIGGDESAMSWLPEPYSFGSKPSGDAADYPPLGQLLSYLDASVALLANTLRSADDQQLDSPVTWGMNPPIPAWELAVRMVFHNGTHCGQVVDTRRALGLPPLLGRPAAAMAR